jgi:hypothetical protein
MPFSKNQKVAAAIAEHHPEKLYAKNAGMLSMSKPQLHDFASGPIQPKSKVQKKLGELKDPIYK